MPRPTEPKLDAPRPAAPESAGHPARPALALGALLLAVSGCSDCGSCVSPPPPPAAEISLGLVAGDFAGNNLASIVATSTVVNGQINPGNLKTYLSTAPDQYAGPAYLAAGNDPLYLASADLNGDKLPDVVSASFSDGTLSVFLNNPKSPGEFSSPIVLTSPGASQLAIADMNGDGLPDLVSADFNVSLFLQTAPGVFAGGLSTFPGGANWVAVGDLNGDGYPDIALTDPVGVKVLFQNPPASPHPGWVPSFAAPIPVFTQTANAGVAGANLIAIADVNGDGLKDLVITDPGPAGGAAPTVSVLLQDAAHPGQFLAPVSYAIAANSIAQSIVVAPLGGKLLPELPDIVIGGSGAVSVLLHNAAGAAGTFLAAANYPVTSANEIALADVNGDGLADIVVGTGPDSSSANGVTMISPGVLLQIASAPGTFSAVQNIPQPAP